jgi:hypothetical protein
LEEVEDVGLAQILEVAFVEIVQEASVKVEMLLVG